MKNILTTVTFYLENPTRKKRHLYFITLEPWYPEVEAAMAALGIPEDWPIQRRLHHLFLGTAEVPRCPKTGLPRNWRPGKNFDDMPPYFSEGYSKYASREVAAKANHADLVARLQAEFGVTNQFQLPDIKEKSKQTVLEKYGVDNVSKCPEIKTVKEQSMLTRYGYRYNFDVAEDYMVKKYGVRSPAHLSWVHEKTAGNRFKKWHAYKLPSGTEILLQGYEPLAFDLLLSEHRSEEQILHKKSDMPKIFYTSNGSTHRYYADFYIPSENLLIEVKSKYTYNADIAKNKAKEQAAIDAGFDYRLIIIDPRGEKNTGPSAPS